MATIWRGNKKIEIPDDDPKIITYRALSKTADIIGLNNYKRGLYPVKKGRRGQILGGYSLTEAHKDLVEAMPLVLSGEMSEEEGKALLWRADVWEQRFWEDGTKNG